VCFVYYVDYYHMFWLYFYVTHCAKIFICEKYFTLYNHYVYHKTVLHLHVWFCWVMSCAELECAWMRVIRWALASGERPICRRQLVSDELSLSVLCWRPGAVCPPRRWLHWSGCGSPLFTIWLHQTSLPLLWLPRWPGRQLLLMASRK